MLHAAYPVAQCADGWLVMGAVTDEDPLLVGIHKKMGGTNQTLEMAKTLVLQAQEIYEMDTPKESTTSYPAPSVAEAKLLGQEVSGMAKPYYVLAMGPGKVMAYALNGTTLSVRVEWPKGSEVTPPLSVYKGLGFKVAVTPDRYASIHLDVGEDHALMRKCLGAFLFALGTWDEVEWSEPAGNATPMAVTADVGEVYQDDTDAPF